MQINFKNLAKNPSITQTLVFKEPDEEICDIFLDLLLLKKKKFQTSVLIYFP